MATDPRVHVIRSLHEEAVKYRNDATAKRWDTAETYFYGRQSRFGKDIKKADRWKANTITNHIYAYYQSLLAVLMRDLPVVDAQWRYPNDEDIAKWLSKEIAATFRANEFSEREEEAIFSFFNFGLAYWKPTWDGRMNDGLGGTRIDTVSARALTRQPGKHRVYDCSYLFEDIPTDKITLLSSYPEHRDELLKRFSKEKGGSLSKIWNNLKGSISRAPEQGTRTDGTGLTTYTDASMSGASEPLVLTEAWFKDDETIHKMGLIREADGDSSSYKRRERDFRKYPTGRMIRFIDDLILEDKPNPFPCFPYCEITNMSTSSEFPLGEVDQLIPIQRQIDTRNNQLSDALNHSVTGDKVLIDGSLGINIEELSNDPAKRYIPARDIRGHAIIPGPRIPGEAFLSLDKKQAEFDRVSGYPEAVIQSASSQRSGYTVEQLTDLAQGRAKLKSYSIETGVRELCRQITGMIGLFYIRGVHTPFDMDVSGLKPDLFDFYVRAGLNLPASRRLQEQKFLRWYQLGLCDEQYVVDNSDAPDKDALIARMQPVWDAKKNQTMMGQPPSEGSPPNLQVVG